MNEKLKIIIAKLNEQLDIFKSELSKYKSNLEDLLRQKLENQDNILEKLVPDKKLSTINSLKKLFPELVVSTKRVKFIFTVADITLEKLRSEISILASKNSNFNGYIHPDLKSWEKYYYQIRFLEGTINLKNQEIENVQNSLTAVERLLKINKNKLSEVTTKKINDELNYQTVNNDNPLDNFLLWALLFDNNQIASEILGIENAGDFDPQLENDVTEIVVDSNQGEQDVEIVENNVDIIETTEQAVISNNDDSPSAIAHDSYGSDSGGSDAGEWNKNVFN